MWGSGFGMMNGFFTYTKPVDSNFNNAVPNYVVVLGDMNFRVTLDANKCLRAIDAIKQTHKKGMNYQHQIAELVNHDQLTSALRNDRSLRNLREKMITFLPTYKLEEQADHYSYEKQRTPSWYGTCYAGQTEY